MLPKNRRIPRRLFPTDPRSGAVFHASHLSLRFTTGGAQTMRVSVVISKKIAQHTADRHLFKRRIYDIVARATKGEPTKKGTYIFFAKKDAHTVSYAQLRDETRELLDRAFVKPHALV